MEAEETSYRPSMLYSVLPTVISNHLPSIASLRQSINDVRNRGSHSKSASVDEIPQPETPPPGYSSTPPSGSVTPYRLSVALGEADVEFVDDGPERPGSSGSALPQPYEAQESSCGIRWKYASLGMEGRSEHQPCMLTSYRNESNGSSIPRIKRIDWQLRRDIRDPHSTTLHTRHNLPTSRTTNKAYTRRDFEHTGSSSARLAGHNERRQHARVTPRLPTQCQRSKSASPRAYNPASPDRHPRPPILYSHTVPPTIHQAVPIVHLPVRAEASNHKTTRQYRRRDCR
jgi:hypothetical protein